MESESNEVPQSGTAPAAERQFHQDTADGPGMVTILCTLKSEEDRRKYLEVTREIVLPAKQEHPSCVSVAQTLPSGEDAPPQVLWIQQWDSIGDFQALMQQLFRENPRLSEVNDYLAFEPEVTIAQEVQPSDL